MKKSSDSCYGIINIGLQKKFISVAMAIKSQNYNTSKEDSLCFQIEHLEKSCTLSNVCLLKSGTVETQDSWDEIYAYPHTDVIGIIYISLCKMRKIPAM